MSNKFINPNYQIASQNNEVKGVRLYPLIQTIFNSLLQVNQAYHKKLAEFAKRLEVLQVKLKLHIQEEQKYLVQIMFLSPDSETAHSDFSPGTIPMVMEDSAETLELSRNGAKLNQEQQQISTATFNLELHYANIIYSLQALNQLLMKNRTQAEPEVRETLDKFNSKCNALTNDFNYVEKIISQRTQELNK